MKYYKIKSKKENLVIKAKKEWGNQYLFIGFLIVDELITKKELEKFLKIDKYTYFSFECDEIKKSKYIYTFNELINECFEIVNINKNKTAFFFGARKEVIQ